MKHFKVRYIDSERKVKNTNISAKTKGEAMTAASQLGRVIHVKRTFNLSVGKMSLADRLILFQRLSSMLSARVGTTDALQVLEQSFGGTVREASRILRERIMDHGEQLHEAMLAAGPRYFPESIVAIIETGSQGGDMAYAIREAARFERELAEVKKESGKGLFSAFGGFVVGIITILASTKYVAPEILESSFIDAAGGADIGWVMLLADWTTWIALAAAGLVGALLFLGFVLRPVAPALVDRIILKIPFYRDMVLAKANYMVFFGLAVLLKAGLRVEEALSLTISSAPRGELKDDLIRARTALVDGGSTPWPFVMNMLHPTDKAALATAQDREQIARTIEELAVQYQALYRSRMESFVPMLQGFSALFLSLAGFVLFGVSIVPLMQSSSAVLGGI